MKSIHLTPQLERKRKFMLLLPLLVLPFLTLLFWSMKSNDDKRHGTVKNDDLAGLNTHLPGAQLKDTGSLDKLSFYEQADEASRKLKQQREQDPYTKGIPDSSIPNGLSFTGASVVKGESGLGQVSSADQNEQQIYQRLNKLQAAMNQKTAQPPVRAAEQRSNAGYTGYATRQAREDPELRQMNSIMEKLVQLQQPGTVKQSLRDPLAITKRFRAVAAMIDGKQRISDNTVIRMKLLDSVTIGGQLFAKGQLVFAAGTFSNQRMKLDIRSIHIGNTIYPVDLTVFDAEDGLEGISVPEAVTDEALRNGATAGVQSMDLMSMDPSVSAQLATAGVNTAKGLFSKKVKRIKAKLQDKRPILLRINQPVLADQTRTR